MPPLTLRLVAGDGAACLHLRYAKEGDGGNEAGKKTEGRRFGVNSFYEENL